MELALTSGSPRAEANPAEVGHPYLTESRENSDQRGKRKRGTHGPRGPKKTDFLPPCNEDALSLGDVMWKVPRLVELSVLIWKPFWGLGIRVMRLVCKDMAMVILPQVQSAKLQAANGANPDVYPMSRLLRNMSLMQVDVSVIVKLTEGGKVPNPAEQCRESFLHGKRISQCMRLSMHSLTHLHLTVRLVWGRVHPRTERTYIDSDYEDSRTCYPYSIGSSNLHVEKRHVSFSQIVNCPPTLVDVPFAVYKQLAVAVPNLKHLSVLGHNIPAALSAFGAKCPKLHSLTLEASSVPPEVLHNLHLHVPGLEHVSMMRRGDKGHSLTTFVSAGLVAFSLCGKLNSLDIDFGKNVEILCAPELWNALPRSLRRFRSTAVQQKLREAALMFSTLTHVDMVSSPYSNLLDLMSFAPCMEELVLINREIIVLDCSKMRNADCSVSPEQSLLQHRLSTMSITCPRFKLTGTYAEVDEVMSWLSPVASTDIWIEITSCAATEIEFLEHAAAVFPRIKTLDLIVAKPVARNAWEFSISEDRLAWLMACKTLKQLNLRHHILWTNAGLSRLCMSLPLLHTVKCILSPGLDHKDLEWELDSEKPGCYVNLYCV